MLSFCNLPAGWLLVIFFTFQWNRELEVLCSCHSIAFEAEATRSDAGQHDETVESTTLAECTAPVAPALSCRLIGIRREWPAYGKFETDVHIFIVLASLRSELSPGLDYLTC